MKSYKKTLSMKHMRSLAVLAAILAISSGCAHFNKGGLQYTYRQGDAFSVQVGVEKWYAFVKGGWLGVVYQPEKSDIQIGVDRGVNKTLPPEASDSEILKRQVSLLRRYDDSTVSAHFQANIVTPHGTFSCYRLQSSDPNWNLRSLVMYRDSAGEVVSVGFYSKIALVPPETVQSYLSAMLDAKLIPPREEPHRGVRQP